MANQRKRWEDLFKSYSAMLPEDKGLFLKAAASTLSADLLFLIAASAPPTEGRRYIDMVFSDLWRFFSPLFAREAIKLVRENAFHTNEEMEQELNRRIELHTEISNAHLRELVMAQFKEKRDRKPENAERDAEIYQLRTEDPKKWSWGRLAKRFGINDDAARKAFVRFKERTK